MSKISDQIRESFKKGDDIRDSGLEVPKDIECFLDIEYGENKDFQVLDVYRPQKSGDKILPVIVSVHGGGWVYGDKERYKFYCMSLAQKGFAVINFTYRLAPEYKFPAPLEDTNLVVEWMLSNAEEFKFDLKNTFAVGDSAGAHILSLYSAMCTNKAYANNFKFKVPEHFIFNAIALNCGAYFIKMDTKEEKENNILMYDFISGDITKEKLHKINPGNFVTDDFPPTFLMTCEADFLKNQSPIMANSLLENNVFFEFKYFNSKDITLQHVFNINIKLEEADICNEEECNFFRSFMV